MDVNFFGAVQLTQAALPSLLERRGRVAALSSVAVPSTGIERWIVTDCWPWTSSAGLNDPTRIPVQFLPPTLVEIECQQQA